MECPHCHHTPADNHTLCPACELAFAMLLLRLATWLDPLHASLDATLHPGGHQPTRIIQATAPTPIRLDVLDLLDALDATARTFWRRLEGINALDWRLDKPPAHDLTRLLADLAEHPQLATITDADMWFSQFEQLEQRVLEVIDVPDRPKPIGHCPNPLCGVQLCAMEGQSTVECPMCGHEWPVTRIRLDLLASLADSDHLFTLTGCARLLNQCGYQVTRKQLQNWRDRGLITPEARDSKGSHLFRMRDIIATLRNAR